MADFAQNLDDGELFLPSDILFEEILCTHEKPSNSIARSSISSPKFPCELPYMEDLAQQLATYALLERNLSLHPPKPPPSTTQQFRPVRSLQTDFGLRAHPAVSGNSAVFFGNGRLQPGSTPGYRFYPVKPNSTQTQLESVTERTRLLQRQQQNPVQNRFLPLRHSNRNSFGRKSEGTGVFLPRAFLIPDVGNEPIVNCAQHPLPMRSYGNQEMTFQHQSPDMGLPQHWTY